MFGVKKVSTESTSLGDDRADLSKIEWAICQWVFKTKKKNMLSIVVGLFYVLSPVDLLSASHS